MLRALASYFFGGIEDETPEAPIDCETREVNDWLVVNLPDQNKDRIDLDEDEAYEIDDEDVGNEMDEEDDPVELDVTDVYEMDLEEDDILSSVSFLMMPQDNEKVSWQLSNNQIPIRFESSVSEQCLDLYPILPLQNCFNYFTDNVIITKMRNKEAVAIFSPPVQPEIKRPKDGQRAFLDILITKMIQKKRDQRKEIVNEYERVRAQTLNLTPPPAHSKSYVNHRHPEKLLNNDILQRIKELEPEQKAVQQSAKKILTRSQLNRQNKNYIYETSSKKNRRSNRQRNHSGANNNRKC